MPDHPVAHVDFDLHGIVGVRLIDPSPSDLKAVQSHLGKVFMRPFRREPDVTIRFVKHLPLPGLRFLGQEAFGFTDDEFLVLKSAKQDSQSVLDLRQIGRKHCLITCRSGVDRVPLLVDMVNMAAVAKGYAVLHASAFVHAGVGVLVAGWAKSGKTEALLAFTSNGARYIGDEWIWVNVRGDQMYGLPGRLCLWDWHLRHLPELRRRLDRKTRLLFRGIKWVAHLDRSISDNRDSFLGRYRRKVVPALLSQLNVKLEPEKIFGEDLGSLHARPEKFFLLMNQQSDEITVQPMEKEEVVQRMISSIIFEQLPLMQHYWAFRYAFPERRNTFLEECFSLQAESLAKALSGCESFLVQHPYPFSFPRLYERMEVYCRRDPVYELEQRVGGVS